MNGRAVALRGSLRSHLRVTAQSYDTIYAASAASFLPFSTAASMVPTM